MATSPKMAAGCGTLFAAPFLAIGGGSGFAAVRALVRGEGPDQWALLSAAAVAFGGAGLYILISALAGSKQLAAIDALRARHPSEPWLWNPEWMNRRISDHAAQSSIGLWSLAIIVFAISSPGLVFFSREYPHNRAAVLAFLFPAVSIAIAVAAVRATLRARRFRSQLVLDTLPAAIGGAFRAHVEIAGDTDAIAHAQSINVTLTSLRRVTTRSGKSTTTSDSVLWQDSHAVASSGSVIPVEFALPSDAAPCDESNANDKVVWRVNVDASVPGIDYAANFYVPVFRTGAPVTTAPMLHVAAQPLVHTIPERETAEGLRLEFAPMRAPSMAAGTLGFTAIWFGAIALMIKLGAPIVMTAIFIAFGLLLVYGTVSMFFRSSSVTVSRDAIRVETKMIVPLQPKVIARGDIATVQLKIREQSSSGTSATAYYDVEVVTRDGKTTTLGNLIRDKHEAEHLVDDIRRRLQISS